MKRRTGYYAATVSIALCVLLVAAVAFHPLVAASIFLTITIAVFALGVRARGFRESTWRLLKELLTGW